MSSVVPGPKALKLEDVRHGGTATSAPLDVAAVFGGREILVLGGTGFLGKVFWVQLLTNYPGIKTIHLLVRSKKGVSSEERFWKEIASTNECLQPLRDLYGDKYESFLRSKLAIVDGDVGLPQCGLTTEWTNAHRGVIGAVVNVAGVVDFNPPLDEALAANAFGSQNLVSLARALGDAPLFHTSTCYTAGRRRGPILEDDPRVHPFPRSGELDVHLWDPDREIAECLELIEQAKHRVEDAFRQSEFADNAKRSLERRGEPTEGAALADEIARVKRKFMTAKLVEAGLDRATHWGWPNIYTYTKSIGEQVVARSGLPFLIARPACCESTVAFPFPGWNEGISTSAPINYLVMRGQVQVPATRVPLDFIPSDMVTAGMILALAELLEGSHKPVYQFGASDTNPATAARLGELMGLYKRKHFGETGKGNLLWNKVKAHVEPSMITAEQFNRTGSPAISGALRGLAKLAKSASGAVPMLSAAAKQLESVASQEDKVGHIMGLFAPFTTEWNGPFSCASVRAAYARATDADKAKLVWAPETIDWYEYMMDVHLPALDRRVHPELDKRLKKPLKPLAAHATLTSLLVQMSERHGDAVALGQMEDDGFSRITYKETLARAKAAAGRLAALGVKPGDRVLLAGRNHPDWALGYFGILFAGATAVPCDPVLEPEALENVARESRAVLALWDEPVEAKSGAHVRATCPTLAIADLHDVTIEPTAAEANAKALELTHAPSDIASLLYTSGTTGTPKGVMLTHANFTSLIASLAPIFLLKPGDRVLSVLPLHHTFEFTCGLLLPLSRGARVAYVGELTAEKVAEALKRGRVTAMVGVPALWQMLERRITSEIRARGKATELAFDAFGRLNRVLGSKLGVDAGKLLFGAVHAELGGNVRYLISGGAALPQETRDVFASLGLHLTEGYGLTEAAPVLAVTRPRHGSPGRAGEVGAAIPGVEIRIENPDDLGVGEVMARGPNVMAGYTDPEATAQAMENGWLRTGDLGKLDSKGRLTLAGRSKDVVITATGENVHPDDLERRLGAIEFISELAIVGVETGTGERIACLAVPAPDEDLERAQRIERSMRSLRLALAKLPYSQQPAIVHLYDAPLPRTATRKVKREEVRTILLRLIAATSSRPSFRPHGESRVRAAIAALKGIDITSLQESTRLQADLGFDSLLLTELLEALDAIHATDHRGTSIDPRRLQECHTVGDVETLVSDTAKTAAHARNAPPRVSTSAPQRAASKYSPEDEAPRDLTLPPAAQAAGKEIIGKFQDAFYGEMMHTVVTGRAFIPQNRNTIVVSNHASHLDMGLVRHALGTYGEDVISLGAQDYFFESGVKRAFFENLTNVRSIDRSGALRQTLREVGEILDRGKTVLIFPEGTRTESGELGQFRPLIGHLALAHDVDLLPVWLGGTFSSMPRGRFLPTKRDLKTRIGPPFMVKDMRRLTAGMNPADAAREVTRLVREAVIALSQGTLIDFSRMEKEARDATAAAKKEHPLVTLFAELEAKFQPRAVDKPVSFYFTLGNDAFAKWTVRVDEAKCDVRAGKPESGQADCVLKTSAEIFTKIVREAYVPGAADFMSGAVKSNDVSLLFMFQKAFALDQAST